MNTAGEEIEQNVVYWGNPLSIGALEIQLTRLLN
jgi:hypothetical protein